MNSFPQYIVKLRESSDSQIVCIQYLDKISQPPTVQSKSQVEAQETLKDDYVGGPCSDVEERWRQFSFHKAGAGIVIYFLDGDRWAGGGAVGGVTGSCAGTRGRSPARTSPSTPSPGG